MQRTLSACLPCGVHASGAFVARFTLTIMEEKRQPVTLAHFGRPVTVSIRADCYRHGGGLAAEVIDEANGERYTTLSINIGAVLANDEFVFKTYSENEGLLEAFLEAGVIEKTGREVEVGMAGPQPICRLLQREG